MRPPISLSKAVCTSDSGVFVRLALGGLGAGFCAPVFVFAVVARGRTFVVDEFEFCANERVETAKRSEKLRINLAMMCSFYWLRYRAFVYHCNVRLCRGSGRKGCAFPPALKLSRRGCASRSRHSLSLS